MARAVENQGRSLRRNCQQRPRGVYNVPDTAGAVYGMVRDRAEDYRISTLFLERAFAHV